MVYYYNDYMSIGLVPTQRHFRLFDSSASDDTNEEAIASVDVSLSSCREDILDQGDCFVFSKGSLHHTLLVLEANLSQKAQDKKVF